MKDLLEEHLGRILLALALAWAGAAAFWGQIPPFEFTGEREISDAEKVQVKIALEKSAAAETFFPERTSAEYREPAPTVFVPEKKVIEYRPVELTIPPASVSRPPQLLPSPGPALEGTSSLPRWGDEFSPLVPPPPAENKEKK